MLSPQRPAGEEAMADVNVKMAMDILTGTLPVYGAGTDKGRSLMKVLTELSKEFGVQASKQTEAVPAEIAALVSSLQGAPGQPTPQPIAGGAPLPAGPTPGA